MKRNRSKCKFHIIGQYWYNGSEQRNFCLKSDITLMSELTGITFYQYCPMCGEKITEKIKTYQMNIEVE